MSKLKDTNAKLPDDAWTAGRSTPTYPFLHTELDALGRKTAIYRDPTKPTQAFEHHTDHSGAITTSEVNPSYTGMTTTINYENRVYTVGGDSKNTDGHKDDSVGATKNETVVGDAGHQVGGDHHHGVAGKKIQGAGDGSFQTDVGGHTYKSSSGDIISDHDGNHHSNYSGDFVEQVNGNKHEIIGFGERVITVNGGNMDINVLDGQFHVHSQQPLTVNSSSSVFVASPISISLVSDNSIVEVTPNQISLVIGSSSIVMTSSKITITSSDIEFVKA